MGAVLLVIDDDCVVEKKYCYIEDRYLDRIVEKSKEKNFDCLSYVLWYENTMFNSVQMEVIEQEVKSLKSCFDDNDMIVIFNTILEAINFAKKDPPLYLLFEGD